MKKIKKSKASPIEQFIRNCSKSKGFEVPQSIGKWEAIKEYILENPCVYPIIIEYVGEQSANGLLNLEGIQDEIAPDLIEALLEMVSVALETNED